MYNLDFGDNQDTKRFIQDALKTKYTELSIVECFVYAILHFLEEYVICPILGDPEPNFTNTDFSGDSTESLL